MCKAGRYVWVGGGGDYLKCLKRGRTERIGGEINNLKGGGKLGQGLEALET